MADIEKALPSAVTSSGRSDLPSTESSSVRSSETVPTPTSQRATLGEKVLALASSSRSPLALDSDPDEDPDAAAG
jgi:hypothetical protein